MNVLLTGILVVLLVVVLLKRRAAGTPAAETAQERTRSRRPSLPTLGLPGRRTTSSDSSDVPRQRRQRLKLGLAVTGLPSTDEPEETVTKETAAADDPPVEFFDPEFTPHGAASDPKVETTPDQHGVDEDATPEFDDAPFEPQYAAPDSGPIYPPLELDLASYASSVAPVPVDSATHHEDENGVVYAPGWPTPGEISAELDDFAYYASGATATTETASSQPEPDAPETFGLAEAWSVGDERVDPDSDSAWAEPAVTGPAETPPSSWDEAPVELMVAADAVGDETPTWSAESWDDDDAMTEVSEHDDEPPAEAWQEPDWSWEPDGAEDAPDVDAPLPAEAAVVEDDEAVEWESLTNDARDVMTDEAPGLDAHTAEWVAPAAVEATAAESFEVVVAVDIPDEPIAQVAPSPAAETLDPTPVAPQQAPVLPTVAGPEVVRRAQPRVDSAATKKLAKRVAAAESELQRIAKRTSGKKGDLRKAGKKKIAKQVRKALRDPELSARFDVRVGRGRLSFERRDDDLALGAVHPTTEPSVAQDLLQALEGPLRASLLSNLLADYATAEANRRVAEVLRHRGAASSASDDFDQIVARLTAVSQGPLLGIAPASPTTTRAKK